MMEGAGHRGPACLGDPRTGVGRRASGPSKVPASKTVTVATESSTERSNETPAAATGPLGPPTPSPRRPREPSDKTRLKTSAEHPQSRGAC